MQAASPPQQQQPTCTNLRVRSVVDAHKIFFAIRQGRLRMVTRRLDADERAALRTGCVYAWEERSQNADITGIGIERFTEGKRWSASRVRDEFLFYYEKYVGPSDSNGTTSTSVPPPQGWEQLVKQTYSVFVETPRGRRKWHLTAYFTQPTVDHLGTVDDLDGVGNVQVPPNLFSTTRIGRRRPPDAEGITHPVVQRVYAPFPLAPRPVPISMSSTSSDESAGSGVRMFDPYQRPTTPLQLHYNYDVHPPPAPFASTSAPADGWQVYPLPLRSIHSPRSEYSGSSGSASGSAGSRAVSTSPRLHPLYDYAAPSPEIPSINSSLSSPRSVAGMDYHPPPSPPNPSAPTLAPLKTLMRIQPYRREPSDESALRMFRDPDERRAPGPGPGLDR
ncbi:hypothetical protein C8F01DRAFT_1181515 [Mycena amicta]|nr:hypothetical protein C8F01DRAFT_1181515 [Mycena amicta]